jgi:hypothetical protein
VTIAVNIKTRHTRAAGLLVLLAAVAFAPGCSHQSGAPPAEKPAAQQAPVLPAGPGAMPPASGSPTAAAGVAWTLPRAWEVTGARPMRLATYRIRAIAGDPEDAECAVYFFGTGQGGTVEANLDRWTRQFTAADGQSIPPSKIETRQVGGMKISTLAVSGTYLGGGAMMTQQEVKKPNFRMRAAIIEAPEGLLFFKLTGPLNTVAAAEGDFNSLLESLHRQ